MGQKANQQRALSLAKRKSRVGREKPGAGDSLDLPNRLVLEAMEVIALPAVLR